MLLDHYPGLYIQASGGIRSSEDIKQLAKIGVNGAIIGRALYENQSLLSEVLRC
jgi:phosphoribosylformimino-5-aminoimidazole carboxamide ribotide isomerase